MDGGGADKPGCPPESSLRNSSNLPAAEQEGTLAWWGFFASGTWSGWVVEGHAAPPISGQASVPAHTCWELLGWPGPGGQEDSVGSSVPVRDLITSKGLQGPVGPGGSGRNSALLGLCMCV